MKDFKFKNMKDFKFKGEDLTFHKDGDIIHCTYGKLENKSSEIAAWSTLVNNFQSSDTYPYIQLLAREVWDKVPVPPLFGVEYKIDRTYISMSPIVNLSKPYVKELTISSRSHISDFYLRVNTPKPFHFWDEESIDKVLNLINIHIEEEKIEKEAKKVRSKQAQKDILLAIKELLKDNPNLVLTEEESWSDAEIEVQFNGKWIGVIEVTDFSYVALPDLYKQLDVN